MKFTEHALRNTSSYKKQAAWYVNILSYVLEVCKPNDRVGRAGAWDCCRWWDFTNVAVIVSFSWKLSMSTTYCLYMPLLSIAEKLTRLKECFQLRLSSQCLFVACWGWNVISSKQNSAPCSSCSNGCGLRCCSVPEPPTLSVVTCDSANKRR